MCSIQTVNIPGNVLLIDLDSFSGCESLESVTIAGNGNTTIEDGAFSGCEKLETVTIGEGVKTIGTRVFVSCTALTNLTI